MFVRLRMLENSIVVGALNLCAKGNFEAFFLKKGAIYRQSSRYEGKKYLLIAKANCNYKCHARYNKN